MEQEYLIDTNAVIDYLDNKLPKHGSDLIEGITTRISVITRIELLVWINATTEQTHILQQFVNVSLVYNLDEPVIVVAIHLRKTYKIKLPDAIIAATALIHNFTLITRNVDDFKNIDDLKLINPHELKI
ncbi:MAG: type II toxin-antitoxin system VapC family toxin [Cyclobacteriaceae bacterium]